MTRAFRVVEDERRYLALRSELFIRLARSGLSAQTVTEIMRNFGKCEDFLFAEGVRQGVAAAVLEAGGILPLAAADRDALSLHFGVYGTADTPLSKVEAAFAGNDPRFPDHPLLTTAPIQFPPMTLTEALDAYGPDLKVEGAPTRPLEPAAAPRKRDVLDEIVDAEDPLELLSRLGPEFSDEALDKLDAPQPENQPLERPELLDRVREILKDAKPPPSWTEMILFLQRELRFPDAAYLDEMMRAPMGMTVLSQCQLFHLHPGATQDATTTPR